MMPNKSKFETEHDSDSDSNDDSYSSDRKPQRDVMSTYPQNRNSLNKEDGEESSCDNWEEETYPSAMTNYVRELVVRRRESEQYSDYESPRPEQLSVPLTNTSYLTDYNERVQEYHPSYTRSSPDLHYDNYPKVCEEPSHSDDNKYFMSPSDPYDNLRSQVAYQSHPPAFQMMSTTTNMAGVGHEYTNNSIVTFKSYIYLENKTRIYCKGVSHPIYSQDMYSCSDNQPDYPQNMYSRSDNQPDYPQNMYSHSDNQPDYPQNMYSRSDNQPDYPQDMYSRSNNQPDYPQDMYSHSNNQPDYPQDMYSRSNNQPDYPQDMYSRSNNQPEYPNYMWDHSNNHLDYSSVRDAMTQDRANSPTKSCLSDELTSSPCHNTLSTDEDCSIQDDVNKPMDIIDDKNNVVSMSIPENKPDASIDLAFKVELGLLKAKYVCSQDSDFVKKDPNNSSSKQDIFEGKKPNSPPPEVIFEGKKPNSPPPEVIFEGKKPNSPPSEVIFEGKKPNSPPPEVIFEGKKPNSPPPEVIFEGKKPNSLPSEVIFEGKKPNSPPSEVIFEGKKPNSPPSEVIFEGKKPNSPPSEVIFEGKKPNSPPPEVIFEGEKPNSPPSEVIFEGKKPNSPPPEVIFEGKKPNSPPSEVVFEGAILNVQTPTKTNNKQTYFEEKNDQTLMESSASPSTINNDILPPSEFVDVKTALTPIEMADESCKYHENMTTTDQSLLYNRDDKSDIKPIMCVDEKPRPLRKYVKKKLIETPEVTEYRKKLRSWARREQCLSAGLPEKQSTVKQEHLLTIKQETKFRSNIKPKREVIEQRGFQKQSTVKQEHILTTKQETKFLSNIKPKREVIEQWGLQKQSTVKQEHLLTIKQETKFRSNIKPKREVIEQQGLRRSARIKSALEKLELCRARLLTK